MKEAFYTLLSSWGMDTPPEAIWGLNKILKWAKKSGFETDKVFEEQDGDGEHNTTLANELAEFFENRI